MPEREGIRGKPFKMSRFHCQEMLYDYMIGRLDPQRRKAVEEFLATSPELQAELRTYQAAAEYCETLSKIRVSPTTIDDLEQIRLRSEVVAEKVRYKNWPDLLKWSSEAVVISVFVAGLGLLIPWNGIREMLSHPPSNEVVLADVDKTPERASSPAEVPSGKSADKPGEKAAIPPVTGAPKPIETSSTVIGTGPAVAKPAAPPVPEPMPIPVPKPPVAAIETKEPTPTPTVAAPSGAPRNTGNHRMLYRIMMERRDIATLAPQIRDKIVALGGKKAGEVEIGWRQPGQNYFHFSMPEVGYDQLLTLLGTYGSARTYKSPHGRTMPVGTIRIILTITDGNRPKPAVRSEPKSSATSSPSSGTQSAAPADPTGEATPSGSIPSGDSTSTEPLDDTSTSGDE